MSEPRRLRTADALRKYRTEEPTPDSVPPAASEAQVQRDALGASANAGRPYGEPDLPGCVPYGQSAAPSSAPTQYNVPENNVAPVYPEPGASRLTTGRQLHPSQRQEMALRQARSQNRGADRYAAYTTSGIDRAELEAMRQAREQAQQAQRSAQAEQFAREAEQRQVYEWPSYTAQPVQNAHAYSAPGQDAAFAQRAAIQAQPQNSGDGIAARGAAQAADGNIQMQRGMPAASVRAQQAVSTGKTAPKDASHAKKGAPAQGGQGDKKKSSAKKKSGGKGGKRKKGLRWWQILLIAVVVAALLLGLGFYFVSRSIRPENPEAHNVSELINTPKEFQRDEFNFLMIGIDRVEKSAWSQSEEDVGDGNTDMVLWVHFNKNEDTMRMLQIPRDYMVTTDRSVSANFRLNNVAKTQGSGQDDAGKWNMSALCELVAEMFRIPVDGYISIHMEDLTDMVDAFGGVSLNVPFDMDYDGSHLSAGYQTLNGPAAEFLLRSRHIYPDGDIGRLNMQRQFYAALFRRVKEMSVTELFKNVPTFLEWMETDLSVSDLASFAVSVLKMPADNIMICQMPVAMGGMYCPTDGGSEQAVVYPARQEDADLLNEYFRENTGPVDASQLELCEVTSHAYGPIDISSMPRTDPNVQFMGDIMRDHQHAQQNDNLDGSGVDYFEEEPQKTAPIPTQEAGSTT